MEYQSLEQGFGSFHRKSSDSDPVFECLDPESDPYPVLTLGSSDSDSKFTIQDKTFLHFF